MKKSVTRRLLAMCLCLTLVSISLVGGTLAKYTSTVTGSASATVAEWNFKAATAGNNETFSVALKGSGTGETLVPGDYGTFTIALDATDSDVDVDYTATFTTIPDGFTLKQNNAQGVAIANNGTVTGELPTTSQTGSIVVYWEYPESTTAPITWSDITISVVGEQATDGADKGDVAATKASV